MFKSYSPQILKQFIYHIIFFSALVLVACKQKNNTVIHVQKSKPNTSSLINNGKVSLELSIPSYGSGKIIFLNCEDNEVFVIIRNNTDSSVNFYETNNSWGYQNYTFIIKSQDSTFIMKREGTGIWKNVPFCNTVSPHESLVLKFNLKKTNCFFSQTKNGLKRTVRRNTDGWNGMPGKSIKQATIQVLYTLPKEYIYDAFLNETIFSDTLSSNILKLSVEKN